MQAGAGKAELHFTERFFPTEGFSRQVSPLYARCAVLGSEAALLSLELTSLPPDEVDVLKALLAEETGVPKERCWVLVTHTFSAPHLIPDHALKSEREREKKMELRAVIHTASAEAIRGAKAGMADAVLRIGTGECSVNVNRDIVTPDGWWIGNDGDGPTDKRVTVLRLDGKDGKPITALFHYPVQSSVLDGAVLTEGGKMVSSDLAGAACALLEARYSGMTALFLLGAAGDQAPRRKAVGEEAALGRELADSATLALESAELTEGGITYCTSAVRVPAKFLPPDIHALRPTHTYDYVSEGERETEIELLRIGSAALMGVKPELNCVTAREIRDGSPFAHTLVMTLVNGGAKYMADAESYERITYEAVNSPFGRGAAELLRDAAVRQLNDLKTIG